MGTCFALLAAIDPYTLVPIVSDSVLAEYRAVLARPAFGFAANDVRKLLTHLERCSETVVAHPVAPILQDVADQQFADLAVTANADAIITGNTRHFAEFSALDAPLLLTPRQALDRVRLG
jgi:uncharacterized protein